MEVAVSIKVTTSELNVIRRALQAYRQSTAERIKGAGPTDMRETRQELARISAVAESLD